MLIKSIIKHPAFQFIIFGLFTISALFIPNFWKFVIIAMGPMESHKKKEQYYTR